MEMAPPSITATANPLHGLPVPADCQAKTASTATISPVTASTTPAGRDVAEAECDAGVEQQP